MIIVWLYVEGKLSFAVLKPWTQHYLLNLESAIQKLFLQT